MRKRKIFFDMDGCLAEYRFEADYEELFKKGYFSSLRPNMSVLEAAKKLAKTEDVYILSSVLPNSKYALQEKNEWLDTYLPEVPITNRLFPPCGRTSKLDFAESSCGYIGKTDTLVDDYGENRTWEAKGRFVKVSKSKADAIAEAKKYENVIFIDSTVAEIVKVILKEESYGKQEHTDQDGNIRTQRANQHSGGAAC